MSARAERDYMGRVASLSCACCGQYGDKSRMRARKLTELDLLADTIERLA